MNPSTSLLSRRSFHRTTAALMAAGLVPAAARGDHHQSRFGGWPIGIQSYSLRKFDLDQAIRHMQGLDLHFVEFYSKHVPLDADGQQLAQLKEKLDAAKIKMSSHGVNGFSDNHEANRKVFEFARRAGLKNITANPTPDSFDSLDRLVDEFDIRVCIHNHGPDALYDKISDVLEAVKGHDKRIGACVDTGHFIRSQEDPVEAVKRIGDRVFALHIKDEAERQKRSHNVVIGQGFLDVPALFKALNDVGFPEDGSISLEYEANPDNPIDDIQQCLVVAEEATAEVPRKS